MSSFWERDLPFWPTMGVLAAFVAAVLAVSRWHDAWSMGRKRQRASEGAEEPDRVWSNRDGGPWIVTFCGQIYHVMPFDLPRETSLPAGLMSDATFRLLARSSFHRDTPANRMYRLDRGDLIAARLVHNTADPDAVPWRIDALDRDRAYHVFGLESERDATNVLELFRRRVLPPDSDGTADAEIDAARRRDELEDSAAEGARS